MKLRQRDAPAVRPVGHRHDSARCAEPNGPPGDTCDRLCREAGVVTRASASSVLRQCRRTCSAACVAFAHSATRSPIGAVGPPTTGALSPPAAAHRAWQAGQSQHHQREPDILVNEDACRLISERLRREDPCGRPRSAAPRSRGSGAAVASEATGGRSISSLRARRNERSGHWQTQHTISGFPHGPSQVSGPTPALMFCRFSPGRTSRKLSHQKSWSRCGPNHEST